MFESTIENFRLKIPTKSRENPELKHLKGSNEQPLNHVNKFFLPSHQIQFSRLLHKNF